MPNRNAVTIIGHLGKDPETRFLDSGQSYTRFSVATNNRYKGTQGDWVDQLPTWWNIVIWGELGKKISTDFVKGDAIHVEGRLKTREYEKDGQKKTAYEVVAKYVAIPVFVKKDSFAGGQESEGAYQEDFEESDIPF
ncbi:MAG: single-stranded DNA-binding protein [Aminobacterium sp.]|uniref:single-stranded DNA-binding protein n=1 Tax=Aminobacterium sp. TaxID=1872491 RepID=UPI002B21FCA3|nr:single-stranded DNA-binding protein [Aminobacterium sp.]MEA4876815.1 single-stranded DNA-binding protein [Aminobacterium sp.]